MRNGIAALRRKRDDVTTDDRSDTELLVASRRDPAAFRVIYDRWARKLLVYFQQRTLDPEAAADLTAETFAVAYLRRHRFRDIGRPAGAWLYGIAARELGRYRRRRGVEQRALRRLGVEVPTLDQASYERIEQLVDLAPLRARVPAALDRLTPGQRDAVRLRVVEELPYREVAARLGCSEGAARVRVSRGLARLGDLLEERS